MSHFINYYSKEGAKYKVWYRGDALYERAVIAMGPSQYRELEAYLCRRLGITDVDKLEAVFSDDNYEEFMKADASRRCESETEPPISIRYYMGAGSYAIFRRRADNVGERTRII